MKYFFSLGLLFYSLSGFAMSFTGYDLRTSSETHYNVPDRKFLVVHFLSSGCPCSQAHYSHIAELQKKYKQFAFVGFHSNKTLDTDFAAKYVAGLNVSFPIFQDKDLKWADKYQAVKTPHVFVYSPKGELLYQGGVTNSRNPANAKNFYLSDALEAIASHKEVKIKDSKTIGCYITR